MIHVHNASAHPFTGWVRTTTDALSLPECGIVQGSPYRLGSANGLRTRQIDLFVQDMPAGFGWEIDPQNFEEVDLTPLPALPDGPYPQILAATFTAAVKATHEDGACWITQARYQIGEMFVVDLWLRRYPDQPWLAHGTATVTCSNVSRPDMTAVSPDLRVRMGDAVCHVFGSGVVAPLVPAGEPWGDGQSRIVYFTMVWLAQVPQAAVHSTQAIAERLVTACGVERLYPEGNPLRREADTISAFAAKNYKPAVAALRTFDALGIGIVKDSGNAGDQEDFGWHGESLDPVGCEVNRIAVAATWPKWPCHHRERDGSPCDPATRPGVIVWKGRASMHGPDRLGKPRDIMLAESYGWSGPDDEHWSLSRLYEAVVTTGCPALQEELAQHARLLIWDCSRTPGWFTSGPRAARSRGWRALAAVRIFDALNDRDLAKRCAHAVDWHAVNVWPSRHDAHPSGFTDIRFNVLGPGAWAMLWQEAVYTYGLDRLGELVHDNSMRERAHKLANAVFKHGYVELPDGTWRTREYLPLDAGVPLPAATGTWNYFGMAMAPAVLLRHNPDHQEARRCIDWLVKNAPDAGSLEWIAPEVAS